MATASEIVIMAGYDTIETDTSSEFRAWSEDGESGIAAEERADLVDPETQEPVFRGVRLDADGHPDGEPVWGSSMAGVVAALVG